MTTIDRRTFHRRVGEGMLITALGSTLAHELGIVSALAEESSSEAIHFGDLDPLVAFMEETPADQLQQQVVARLKSGAETHHTLMRAAALANARRFGGMDYIGMHTLMAMKPAFTMSQQLPPRRATLAILKILHRNTSQIQSGECKGQIMHPVSPAEIPPGKESARLLYEAVRNKDRRHAEEILSASVQTSASQAFNDLLETVEDAPQVHNVVFAHRAWEALDFVGEEHALTMLRQSLRYRESFEGKKYTNTDPKRVLLPKILDEYHLAGFTPGNKSLSDDQIWELGTILFQGTPENSARAVAAALEEGVAATDIGQAISLAANQLVLRDIGRIKEHKSSPDKEIGSIHGDSIGVHASDAANAWRKMAGVGNDRHTIACLILGAYQATHDRINRGGDFLNWEPRPREEELAGVTSDDPEKLLEELDGVIREEDQDRTCAVARKYASVGGDAGKFTDLMLRYAVSEDGALHAEKYYLTTTTDFADTRPAFQWNHLIGLARQTASAYGLKAAGYEEACELLGVEA